MLPPPPRSTLFPYTTLFRSHNVLPYLSIVSYFIEGAHEFLLEFFPGERISVGSTHTIHLIIDRKSTRLNSSHRCISYAVFCLKKKKKKEISDILCTQKNCLT